MKYPLTVETYKAFLLETIDTLKQYDEESKNPYLQERIRLLCNADYISLLSHVTQSTYLDVTRQTKHTLCTQKGIIGDLFQKRHPVFIDRCDQNLLFHPECDNLTSHKLKNLFILPVFFDKNQDKYPPVLCWGATFEESENTVTQKEILYLIKFLDSLKPYLPHDTTASKTSDEHYINQIETLLKQQERFNLYFYTVIRDIRTPMNAVMGSLELLAQNEGDETKKNYIASAIKSMEQMVHLINDALDYADLEKGQLHINTVSFHPAEEFQSALLPFYEAARKKKIFFDSYIDPNLPQTALSDPHRIKQVLTGLLSNAVKYTPPQGVVSIQIHYQSDTRSITVDICDTGKGIDEKERQHIFTPFYKINKPIGSTYGKTDVSLSVAHQIVSLLGGTLQLVDNTQHRGSRFRIVLPLKTPQDTPAFLTEQSLTSTTVYLYRWDERPVQKVQNEDATVRYLKDMHIPYILGGNDLSQTKNFDTLIVDKRFYNDTDRQAIQHVLDLGKRVIFYEDHFDRFEQSFSGDIRTVTLPIDPKAFYQALGAPEQNESTDEFSDKKPSFANKTVLVVDDNTINLKVMDHILKQFDLNVKLFENAPSAIKYLSQHQADLLIIDENMPEMEGSEAIALLKDTSSPHRNMPIVSLTGDTHNKDKILNAGANEVIFKPVKIDEIASILRRYLSARTT